MIASATSEPSPPTTSTSVGPRNWRSRIESPRSCRRKPASPATRPASPRQPAIAQTIQAGTISEKIGNCRPAIAEISDSSRSADFRQRDDRRAERAERDRRGVGQQRQARGVERREAEADHQRRRNGHRRAEAGRAFDERAEAERDQQRLHAPVGRQRGDRRFHYLELARLDRQRIQEDRRQHDPADRKQAEARAEPADAAAIFHGMP